MIRLPRLLAAGAVALAGLAGGPAPAQAQQPGGDKVAFKATVAGPVTPFFMIPFDPPIALASNTITGQSDLLGAVTFIVHDRINFGADGVTPVRATDGLAVMTAANGDALYMTFSGVYRILDTGPVGDQISTIFGGKGRFLGAAGSGSWRGTLDVKTNVVTLQIEGMVSRPKP
jgi:hypothetical protein